MSGVGLGLGLLFLAGAMNGSFTIPMKFTHQWQWENTWSIWTIFTLLAFPTLLTSMTIPHLWAVYAGAGTGCLLTVALCGAGWGTSVVFFGLAVDAVGTALAFSIILGISAAVGCLLPLLHLHPEKIGTRAGIEVIGGLILVLAGVAVCAVAGRKREAILGFAKSGSSDFGRGLVLCILSGAGSALLNVGLVLGQPILQAARIQGAQKLWSANAAFLPVMAAGSLPNLAYCLYLMRKNDTYCSFRKPGTRVYWLLAIVMAICWFGSVTFYGIAATRLGDLGTTLAWPIFMSLIVIVAAVWGALTGEWKNAGRLPLVLMGAGVSILIVAVFLLSVLSRRL